MTIAVPTPSASIAGPTASISWLAKTNRSQISQSASDACAAISKSWRMLAVWKTSHGTTSRPTSHCLRLERMVALPDDMCRVVPVSGYGVKPCTVGCYHAGTSSTADSVIGGTKSGDKLDNLGHALFCQREAVLASDECVSSIPAHATREITRGGTKHAYRLCSRTGINRGDR